MGASHWQTIEKLVYHVLFPCLLFHSVYKGPGFLSNSLPLAVGTALVIAAGFCLGALAWLMQVTSFRSSHPMSRIEFASGLQNAYRFNSYIALALASRLLGTEGVAHMAICLAVGVPLCNMLAVGSMSQKLNATVLFEMLKNPLILGTLAGIVAKSTGLIVPAPLMATLERLAQAAVALGLLAVGAGLMFNGMKGKVWVTSWWLLVKLMLCPVVAILYAQWVGLNASNTAILLIFASLPSASSAYILASRMGGNTALVACLISLSTVFAAFTIPLNLLWLKT